MSFNFMAAVNICRDSSAPRKNKVPGKIDIKHVPFLYSVKLEWSRMYFPGLVLGQGRQEARPCGDKAGSIIHSFSGGVLGMFLDAEYRRVNKADRGPQLSCSLKRNVRDRQ